MVKTVVIVGAGFTGLSTAHKLLIYTASKVPEKLKVVLVSPNSHFYWNLAATRGVIPGAIPDEQLFLPIMNAFSRYPSENFEFILGKADRLQPENSVVRVVANDGSTREIIYDQLVIATGSSIRGNLPFKSIGTHEDTIVALHSLQKEIENAGSITIAGAGPTGVETAGELAAAYGKNDLQKLGVKVIYKTKVETSTKEPTGQTKLVLSNGEVLTTDLYLPLFGLQVNTGWLPPGLLDAEGNVQLDSYMRVTGTANVWGIGDVGNLESKQVTATDAQIIDLAENLDFVLTGRESQIKEHKIADKKMIFITLGKSYATGQISWWKVWGWLVAYIKGRKIFVDSAPNYVNGKELRHKPM
ncbi:hypothetical protein TWF569_008216 [Orbilia oligospora]|uniref:FAD/NAD(P)-binding domain-containing protein n=1 Tax=Orbilia oligospora TaxID=2813651 RepID=A0A7C8N7X6_ORBOL|nr:hypothetical protein TWF102_010293 [Orbilia oligospora]KAF3089734.1 hypothetical protein TWF706_010339 [Orbilia oligospora]KAF3108859.1 hypothetical protein TWF103_005448 [Orbilia oligospora]KAF3140459.1 hypothetical protein TWF569_008216 [Orbilia oligospora]